MSFVKWFGKVSLLLCLSVVATAASAAVVESETFRGVDITVVKSRFTKSLHTVENPFQLYHWRRSPDLVNSVEVQQDPKAAGLKILQREAPLFIPGLFADRRTRSNLYGGGLYAAVDPVTSEDYGGGDPSLFALLTIRIPKGFRVLNLNDYSQYLTPDEDQRFKSALDSFDCPGYSLDSIFSSDLSPMCAELVAHLLKSLKVDGFFYAYTSTTFKVCARPNAEIENPRSSAMVFTSNAWTNLPGADARVYTAKTTVDFEERRLIESLFAYSKTIGRVTLDPYRLNILELFEARGVITHEEFTKLKNSGSGVSDSTECSSGEGCLFRISLFKDEVAGRRFLGELKLKAADFAAIYMTRFPDRIARQDFYSTHWEDLQGQATHADLSNWIKKNLYRCGPMDSLSAE